MAAHIQVPDVPPRDQYVADGVVVDFTYGFPIFEDGDIEVYLGDDKQESGYTVAGAGATGGGTVTFDAAPADGVVVTLARALPVGRTTDFTQSGNFQAKVINDELDKIVMMVQQVANAAGLALHVSVTENVGLALPGVGDRADKLLGFDTDGTPIAVAQGFVQQAQVKRIAIASGTDDYDLDFMDSTGEMIVVPDAESLLVTIDGVDQAPSDGVSDFDFTLTGGNTVHLKPDGASVGLAGKQMVVRLIGGAALSGQVATGAIKRPDQFLTSARPVPVAALGATGASVGMTITFDGTDWVPGHPAAIGEVRDFAFAGGSLDPGWLECDGAAISRSTYAALFTQIGTTWGVGDGSTTFNLPDLRGRSRQGAGQGNTAYGGGAGTDWELGAAAGAEKHALSANENGAHTHPNQPGGANATFAVSGGPSGPALLANQAATQSSGLGTAHNILGPRATFTAAIFTGVYP